LGTFLGKLKQREKKEDPRTQKKKKNGGRKKVFGRGGGGSIKGRGSRLTKKKNGKKKRRPVKRKKKTKKNTYGRPKVQEKATSPVGKDKGGKLQKTWGADQMSEETWGPPEARGKRVLLRCWGGEGFEKKKGARSIKNPCKQKDKGGRSTGTWGSNQNRKGIKPKAEKTSERLLNNGLVEKNVL